MCRTEANLVCEHERPDRSLISVDALADLAVPDAATLLDIRWDLTDGARRDQYAGGHIPGAAFVDLDAELAGPPGARGRHPLPETAAFGAAMRAAGVWEDRPVVVYDAGASMAAARAWWLLRYFGHRSVAVLDGGLAAWTRNSRPLESAAPGISPGDFIARPGGMPLIDALGAAIVAGAGRLIDARAAARFRGDAEPIDPVAGHIPGAVNRPTAENLDLSGRFLAPGELRAAFERLGVRPGIEVGAYCGSGVSAAHEVLALELAGYSAALYAGSWSEWITDPARPLARGDR